MNGIYLIIGGNMGERELYLAECRTAIETETGKIIQKSSVYETASWGNEEQNPFLNQVLFIHTKQDARTVLKTCLSIEKKMGRIREEKWGSRIIDIDILFFNHEIIQEDNLKIPHPHMAARRFVLIPLDEIATDFGHPVLNKTVHELLRACEDELEVKKI